MNKPHCQKHTVYVAACVDCSKPATHKTPSHEAVKAAEACAQRIAHHFEDGAGRLLLAEYETCFAEIIDRHFAGLREVKEAAKAHEEMLKNCRGDMNMEPTWQNLRSALSAVEKRKVGE